MAFIRSNKSKEAYPIDFYPWDIVGQGVNMHGQMMGSFNVSFYKLGDKTLSLVQDSKSRKSFYYHAPWIESTDRLRRDQWYFNTTSWHEANKETTTHQKYLFFNRYENN